jgi:HEAT repeat protein
LTRGFASWKVLAALALAAALLIFIQRQLKAKDLDLALGPPSTEQARFFEAAADRPDLELFFKHLTPGQRIVFARNLGAHATAGAAKSAARLLSTFDERARQELADSLSHIAKENPKLVAAELGRGGSFEQSGIFAALRYAGGPGIAAAVEALADGGRRANAIRFLVGIGTPAAAPLLEKLARGQPEEKSAAAEALGTMRHEPAVGPLLRELDQAPAEARGPLIAALADIGDPRAEGILLDAIRSAAASERAGLLLGLGRMATPKALRAIWDLYSSGDEKAKAEAAAAFVLAGERGLSDIPDPLIKLEVASKVSGPRADAAIRHALRQPALAAQAIKASIGREGLANDLWPPPAEDDSLAGLRFEALSSTSAGRATLRALSSDPRYGGFAQRALSLARPVPRDSR